MADRCVMLVLDISIHFYLRKRAGSTGIFGRRFTCTAISSLEVSKSGVRDELRQRTAVIGFRFAVDLEDYPKVCRIR